MSVPSSSTPLNAANIAAAFLFDDEAPPPPAQDKPKRAAMMGGIFRTQSNRSVTSSSNPQTNSNSNNTHRVPGQSLRGPMAPPLRHGDNFAHLPVNLPTKGGFDKRVLVKWFMAALLVVLGLILISLFLFSTTKSTDDEGRQPLTDGLATLSPATTLYPSPSPVLVPALELEGEGEGEGELEVSDGNQNTPGITDFTEFPSAAPSSAADANLTSIDNSTSTPLQWSLLTAIDLDPDQTAAPGEYAHTLALNDDGTVLLVGLPQRSGSTGQVQAWKATSTDNLSEWTILGQVINGEFAQSQFGVSVDISTDGSIICMGGNMKDSGIGHVRVLQLQDQTQWQLLSEDIVGNVADASGAEQLGYSVALSGDGKTIAVASPQFGTNDQGRVQVLTFSDQEGWMNVGDAISPTGRTKTGYAVSMSSDAQVLAVASIKLDGQTGSVQVYKFSNGAYDMIGSALDLGGTADDTLGRRLVLSNDGTTLALADRNDQSGSFVAVYRFDGTTWTQLGQPIGSTSGHDVVSIACSQDCSILAVGINDPADGDNGHVQVYQYNEEGGGNWEVYGGGPLEGMAVGLSTNGDILAVGNTDSGVVAMYQHVTTSTRS